MSLFPALSKGFLEWVVSWAEPITYTAAFVAGAAGLAYLLASRPLNRILADEKRVADSALTKFQNESKAATASADARAAEAMAEAAKAAEGTAKAGADAAAANERAATATALAESFRLDIARANERAAAANETAEKERLARLQLEARLADRVITDAQRTRLTATFAALKGETVDVGMFGDNPDIANVNGAIVRCLEAAGARIQTFSPLGGGGGVRGVIFAADPNASAAIKTAAQSAVNILRETLGGGVGLVEFSQLKFEGTAMTGNSDGAAERGSGPVRIWIGPK